MDSPKEQRIMNDLLAVVDRTRAGADPTEAMSKMAEMRGHTPQIIERMCEAYNKAKSVHMLQKSASSTRAEAFPLINSRDVIQNVFGQGLEKAAAEFRSVPNLLKVDFATRTQAVMEKQAAERMAGPMEKEADEKGCEPEENFNLVYDRLKKREIREKGAMEKAASDIRQERIRIERTVTDLAEALRPSTNKQLNKIAQKIYNKYGQKGDQLLAVVYAKLNKEKPGFEKTAKTVIFPLAEPFISVTRAMEGYKHYSDLTSAQKKIEKTAGLAHILAAAGLPTLSEAAMEATRRDSLEEQGGTNIMGASLKNRLKKLEAIDAFYDMYTSDDYLRDQPVNDVIKSFNTVTRMMPSLMKDDAKKVYIGPMVKKLIAEGGRLDPTEMGRMASLEQELAKGEKFKQETMDAEEARRKADTPEYKGIGEQSVLEAIAKAGKPRTKTKFFSDLAGKASKGIGGAAKALGDVLKDRIDRKDRDTKAAQDAAEKGMKLEDKFYALGPKDMERLQKDNIIDEQGKFPSDTAKRQQIKNYIEGGAVSQIEPPADDKKDVPLAQKPEDTKMPNREAAKVLADALHQKQPLMLQEGQPIITDPPSGGSKAWKYRGTKFDESPQGADTTPSKTQVDKGTKTTKPESKPESKPKEQAQEPERNTESVEYWDPESGVQRQPHQKIHPKHKPVHWNTPKGTVAVAIPGNPLSADPEVVARYNRDPSTFADEENFIVALGDMTRSEKSVGSYNPSEKAAKLVASLRAAKNKNPKGTKKQKNKQDEIHSFGEL